MDSAKKPKREEGESASSKSTADEERDLSDQQVEEEDKPSKVEQNKEESEQEEKPVTTKGVESPEAEGISEPQATSGPKINFDYPPRQHGEEADEPAENAVPPSRPGPSLDDLSSDSDQPEEEGSQAAQKNPYAEEEDQGRDIPHLQTSRPNQPIYQNQTSGRMQPGAGMNGSLPDYGQNNFQFRRNGNFKSNHSSKIYFLILLVIGLVVLGGAVYLLKHQLKPATPSPSPTPQITIATPSPSPTPAPVDRSKFKVRVLNGTDKTGLASTVSDKLKSLGYQTDKPANASNSAARTLVKVKKDNDALARQLITDLSYQFDATSSANLKDSETVDSEVILGAK